MWLFIVGDVAGGMEGRELTLRTTLTFAAPDPSLGATASTTRRISLCIMRTKSRWFSRWAMSHRCSMKYMMFARLFIEFCPAEPFFSYSRYGDGVEWEG